MNAMELAKRIVEYVDEACRDYNAIDFGVPKVYGGVREGIEEGVANLLTEFKSPPPTLDRPQRVAASTAQVLIAAGVLTQQQWYAAVAFVDAVGEGAK